MKERNWK